MHEITLTPARGRVTVRLGGQIIADTNAALELRETNHDPVMYVPRSDVKMELLERTTHSSQCPYKGQASYYSIPIGGQRSVNAVWTYENPYAAVADIKDRVAFYPDRVDAIEIAPPTS
jgi:uncharacterized protein (DUF427 family)